MTHPRSLCTAYQVLPTAALSRMVLALRVSLELIAVEVNLAQVTGAIALGLIVKVLRRGVAALATRRHSPGFDLVTKLDYCDKAVAARAIPLLCARIRARAE